MAGFILLPDLPAGPKISTSFTIERLRTRKAREAAGIITKRRARLLDNLDLAERWQRELSSGEINQRGIAAREVITPARVSQVLALLRLHPLIAEFVRHDARTSEHQLRPLLLMSRPEQLTAANTVVIGWSDQRLAKRADQRRRRLARHAG